MEEWVRQRLSKCLNFDIPDEMIKYVISLKSTDEIDEYFLTLLDYDLPEHQVFINDFKQKRFGKDASKKKKQKDVTIKNLPIQVKSNGQTVNNKADKQQEKPKTPNSKELPAPTPSAAITKATGTKKKTKYVNLYTKDGKFNDIVMLKGRHHCDCEATKHKLINNCLGCGRIVCEQEGSGPCLFCGELVCSQEEMEMINSSTKEGDHLKKNLLKQKRPDGWEEAIAQRDRLIEFDRNCEMRTTVFDDQQDYFQANSVWLSDAEKKKLERLEMEMNERKHGSRLNQKITFDFAGREIVEEPQFSMEYQDEIFKEASDIGFNNNHNNGHENEFLDMVNPDVDFPAPVYIPPEGVDNHFREKVGGKKIDEGQSRVQDKELLIMQDMRSCLSMHQPYASLLVAGIKKHEGRTWYSAHRGRLWIASTAKPVDMEEVHRLEHFYRVYYNDETMHFPSQYPSGCLLGCVTIEDCLTQEEYRKQYPEGESDSPYVFICKNPHELIIRFPIKGMHKIYKLDPKIHVAAVKSLEKRDKLIV